LYTISTTTVSTRAASKIALTQVLDNVIQRLRISNAFKKCGYEEITDLLQLDDATISNLEYATTVKNTTTTHSLQNGDMGMIRSFVHYVHHCSSIYDPIGNDWISITDDMLDEFRTDLTQIYKFSSVDSIHTTSPSATPSPLSAATISCLYRLNLWLTYSSVVLSETSTPSPP
jgi:monomeric isocitrate dehydrogenase